MAILFYILTIVVANFLSAKFNPVQIGPFLISLGTFTIAACFILRDLVQNQLGRAKTYALIAVALIISAVQSMVLGDSPAIVIASACAFVISETTDTEIYTRLRLPMAWRVWWSGAAGGILDSGVFVVLGLSPLGMDFIPWPFIPMAILGQAIFKTFMQGCGAVAIAVWQRVSIQAVGR